MPILQNPKWERFAINVFQSPKTGWSIGKCYSESGYRARNHSAEQLGSQLLRNIEVRTRIEELSRPVAKKAAVSLEALISRIEAAIAAAQADGAHGAVAQNHALILKIIDMVEERSAEHQFAGAMDFSEIMALIRDLVGDVVAAVVEAAIVGDVYSTDIDKALELIDGIRAALLARVSTKAMLVS